MGRKKLSVLIIFVCAVNCLAMSNNELEDFAEYLKKTSQLNPTLKKGVEPDDYDEDEIASDHAWEESGKFEGDLVLNERQRRLIVQNVAEGLSRNGIRDGTKRWPNNEVIYYIQIEHFTAEQVQAIQNGIDDLARASCVKFRHYRKGDRDAVVIQGTRKGCFSQVGYQGGYQVLNLSGRHPVGRGCFRHGTVVHELLHTLGFYHMQSSPDRDDYVNVIWENILQPARHNFRKYNIFSVSDFGVGYDYDSVLHYSRRAFSANGRDTIVPKKRGAEIGQRIGLSDKDAEKLNKMYCDANLDNVEADEEAKRTKKKSAKNKPFEGHGIGYHQGKAMVIKLSPTAQTYKLTDVPSSHVFDYFSKAPHVLSTPTSEHEGFRADKEVAHSYNSPEQVISHKYKEPVHYNAGSKKQADDREMDSQIQHKNYLDGDRKFLSETNDEIHLTNVQNFTNPNEGEEPKDISGETLHNEDDKTKDPFYVEALDRISKIIKSHVYPSQNPDLSTYGKHEPYNKNDKGLEELKIDDNSAIITESPIRHSIPEIHQIQSAIRTINNLFDLNSYESDRMLGGQSRSVTSSNEQTNNKSKDNKNIAPRVATSENENSNNLIDAPYTMSFGDDLVNKHIPLAQYGYNIERYGENARDKYTSKLRDGKTFSDDNEKWRDEYLPYKSAPIQYDNDADYNRSNLYDSYKDIYRLPVSVAFSYHDRALHKYNGVRKK